MNKLKFGTKIDWFGLTLVLGPAIGISIFAILSFIDSAPSSNQITPYILLVITVIIWLYAILSFGFTYYTIDGNIITARMAYFRVQKINIEDIKELKQQEFGQKVLGLSKDVLSIKLTNGNFLNISPKDIDGLINEIERRRINLKANDSDTK